MVESTLSFAEQPVICKPTYLPSTDHSLAPISGLSERAFKTVIDIDLLGTYNTLKATLPAVRETKGCYLHISATLHYRGTPFQAHVSAAKAGVDALNAVIAVEEGPRGVRSNIIAPGYVYSILFDHLLMARPIGGTVGMDKLAPKGFKPETQIPLGRMGAGGKIRLGGFGQRLTFS